MEKDKKEINIEESVEQLGSWTKEMIKPENVIGVFDSTEEMLKSMLED